MSDSLFLAWAYIRHNAGRSAVLVLALALIVFVPLATRLVLNAAQTQLTARAETTPLMIGARGSALDLMMNGLYFTDDRPQTITMAETERVWDSGFATAIPLYIRYKASGAPIVGTTLDYFDFRGLKLAEGRNLALLGEAVLGANVATKLNLGAGDSLISDPENLFDITGGYPLEMQIVGAFAPTNTADDDAIFVDMTTAWVLEGLGHGHEDVVATDMVLSQTGNEVQASPAVTQFTRITENNINSFHFHGDPETYPVSSVVAVPPDQRNAAVLRGRYVGPTVENQIMVPETVVTGLLATIFRIGRVLDVIFLIVGAAALVAIALAFYLSLKLRGREVQTAFRLGCHRLTIARLLGSEAAIIAILAVILAAAALAATSPFVDDLAVWLVTNQS